MKLVFFFFSGLTWFPKFLYQKMHGIHGSSCFSGSWLLMMTWNKFIPKKGGVADGRVRRPEFEFDAFGRDKNLSGILSLTSWIFVKVNMKVTTKIHGDMNFETRIVFSQVFFYLCWNSFQDFLFPFPRGVVFLSFLLPGLLWTSFFPLDLGVVWKIHTKWCPRKLMKGAGRHQHFPTIREVQPDSCLFVHLNELIQQYLPT